MSLRDEKCHLQNFISGNAAKSCPTSSVFPPRIPQRYCTVEYRFAWFRIFTVGDEVTMALELEAVFRFALVERGFHISRDNFLRMQIERHLIVPSSGVRMGVGKQTVIKPYLGFLCVFRRKPVDVTLDLALFRSCRTALGVGVIGAMDFHDLTAGILHDINAFYNISVTQPYFGSRRETEIAFGRCFHEVPVLDIDDFR